MPQQEYLTDLFYPTRFYDFMSPVMMDYLSALHGFEPHDLSQAFTYCEVGCGGGSTANVLAAANPQGQFYGIDINAEHIAFAQNEAAQGELSNIQFLEADVNMLADDTLPDMDYIAIHGVYSWVSPETREGIRRFIQAKLKPSGMLMLSYNAMPGSSIIMPMRDMMLAYTVEMQDSPALEKVHEGLKYLQYLVEHNAAFFAENPTAKAAINNYIDRSDHYLAHEFFNEYWQPFYFVEVAQHMQSIGLDFVGTLPLQTNYLETSIPSAFHEVFREAPDRVTLERHKAFVRNDRFRRDVYIKATDDALDEADRIHFFQGFYFGTEHDTIDSAVVLDNGQDEIHLDFTTEPTVNIAGALLQEPHTIQQLLAREDIKDQTPVKVLESVQMLELGNACRTFVNAGLKPDVAAAHQGGISIPNAYNRYLLSQCHTLEDPGLYIASQVMGDGVYLTLVEGALLYAMTEHDLEDVSQAVLEKVSAANKHLNVHGEAISDDLAQLELLHAELDKLMTRRLGKFLELGIVGVNK